MVRRSLADLLLVAANLLPLVGVVVWGWDLWALLVVYWTEAFVTVLVGALKALFAEEGSPDVVGHREPLHELRDKRGSWRPRADWPAIYPRNIPFALSLLGVWASLVVPVSGLYWLSAGPPLRFSWGLLAGITALAAAQVGEFRAEYRRTDAYADASARELLREPGQTTLVIVVLGIVGLMGGRAAGPALLVGCIGGKTAMSLHRDASGRVGGVVRRLIDRLSDDDPRSRPRPDPDLPDAPTRARVTVSRTSVLLGSVSAVAFGFMNRTGAIILCGAVAAIAAGSVVWSVVALGAVLAVVVVRVMSYYLRYGTIEYQRRGDALVAYDTLLESPQWVVPIHSRGRFEITNSIPDRLLGTGTLAISGVDTAIGDTVQFGPLADLDRAIAILDLPVRRDERPERDLAVIGAALGLALCFGLVPAGVVFSSQVDRTEAAGVLVVFTPFFLLLIGILLWAALRRI
jgi:hypothetical protein